MSTMVSRYAYHGGVWVDLERPSESEVHAVVKEFGISERLEMEMLTPNASPVVANEAGATFLVLHFPTHDGSEGEIRDQEIDLIVGKDFIVTVRYEVVAPFHHLKKLLETQALIDPHDGFTTDVLLELLFAHLYTAVRDYTSHIAERAARIEHDMFSGLERVTVRAISSISREFLHIEASLANQTDPLDRFLKILHTRGSFGPSFVERADRILGERRHVAQLVATYRAVATELRETNTALLETRQNEIMKTLTLINFIFLPLGLISWVFAMRTEGMPIIDSPYAFWIVLAIMLGVTVLLTTFFIKRRWF